VNRKSYADTYAYITTNHPILRFGTFGSSFISNISETVKDRDVVILIGVVGLGWLRGTVVERRSLAGELHLSCAGPAAMQLMGDHFMWVNHRLVVPHFIFAMNVGEQVYGVNPPL